ncbi:uncharacterized protein LOC103713330 [Phoenix dactylifera]|uniref:Uncharacterized protein LOC103713330 n=1 Tax=Phoenix dactylifera TaxID=42345 RepID=A0A8B7CG65_PHODC|nr:uncharacterized protein LOC103713330 [Phoenix dactylifera]
MPRSSRHRSHRSHKHRDERDRSDSEEDGNSRERQLREEEPAATALARVSRDLEPERRKSTNLPQGKDLIGSSNGDITREHGRKRKERTEDVAVADRWNGAGEDDLVADKKSKGEEFGPVDLDKSSKSKLSASDSKSRSSRRCEGSSERNEESGGKVASAKRRLERDSSRRESDSQYKETKDRDRERASDRDKKTQDSKHARSDDVSRRYSTKTRSPEEEHATKKDIENSEWQIQHDLHNPDFEKELEKRVRRWRDNSEDKDKWLGDGRDSDDRSDTRLYSRDDHTKNISYKDERHEDGKYRDKYRDNVHRDRKHWDDKRRDERLSQDHVGDRTDNKHYRDENKPSESHYKKNKLQDSDHDGIPCFEDHGTKLKDNRGRKRFSEGYEDHGDSKTRGAKEPCEDGGKVLSSTTKIYAHTDRSRTEHQHSDKVDSSPNNNRPKSSASSSAYAVKDHSRHSSKQADSKFRESPSEERIRPSAAASGDRATAVRDRQRVSESRSTDKSKPRDHIHLMEAAAYSQYDRTPRSDAYTSLNKLKDKSPSTSERRFPDRTSARCSLDAEVGQKHSRSKDGDRERELPLERPILDDRSQMEFCNREPTPGISSSNRAGHFSGSSPNHLPPPPPVRLGFDGPSVLGLYEDDNRVQVGDRKLYNRQRKSSDVSLGRGHGNAWRSGPAWPSPLANGFMPLQHGPAPAGFHPAMQQFPGPPLFGLRPPMDLSHTGISYHLQEASDRFTGHGRTFGWHNPVGESCPPHLQVWGGSNGVFGDESRIYGRPEWDQNRHAVGSRGWEMNADMWKGQNGSMNADFPVLQKEPEHSTRVLADEAWVGQPGQQSCGEGAQSEPMSSEGIDAKRFSDTPSSKNAVESPPKTLQRKIAESSETPGDSNANFCAKYLSRIDISLDLADSELYKKCMPLLGKLDMTYACNKSKHEYSQDNKEDIKVRRQGASRLLNSLFPATRDAIFQRAMLLYKKQNEGSNVTYLASPAARSEEKKECQQASDEGKVLEVGEQTSSENMASANEGKDTTVDADVANSPKNMEEAKSTATNADVANSASNMEEAKSTATNADVSISASTVEEAENTTTTDAVGANSASKVEEVKNTVTDACGASSASDMEAAKNIITDAKEQQSDFVSDAAFANGSQACKVLKAECRVNLSRIHDSSESTH